MVIGALAWNLKVWLGLLQPKRSTQPSLITMEFKRFLAEVMLLPSQIVRTGRQLIIRLLQWNPGATAAGQTGPKTNPSGGLTRIDLFKSVIKAASHRSRSRGQSGDPDQNSWATAAGTGAIPVMCRSWAQAYCFVSARSLLVCGSWSHLPITSRHLLCAVLEMNWRGSLLLANSIGCGHHRGWRANRCEPCLPCNLPRRPAIFQDPLSFGRSVLVLGSR